ncbi:MAG: ParB/RepB/Spo0J family partition protein [Janthinobacterium lividum]
MTVQMIQARNCILSPRNVRRTAADPARLETLKASIEARGILQNLIGFSIPKKRGKFEITAGGRRLAAVHGLIEASILPVDYEIPVFVMNDTSAAAETSLAENFERQAMNPADECVAFRHFIEVEGATVDDIAKRFGLTTRFIEGRIRLAGLADDVFEALRAGEISLDVAQAFGTTTDTARQARVYEQLKGSYNGITAIAVRRMMTDETVTGVHPLAKLVGRDAYIAAGGRVEADLFGDSETELWVDVAVVNALAEAKMAEAAAQISGFGAVVPVLATRPDWTMTEKLRPVYAKPIAPTVEQQTRLEAITAELETIEAETEENGPTETSETRWEALQAEAESIENRPSEVDPEIRGAATAFLVIGADGTPTIHTQVYVENTPRTAPDESTAKGDSDTDGTPAIGRVLRDELAVQRTQLLSLHVANDAGMAIDLAIFLLADAKVSQGRAYDRGSSLSGSRPSRAPIDFKPTGATVDALQTMHDQLDYSWAEPRDTGARFDAFRALSDEQRGAWAGWVVAQTLEAKLADEQYSAFHNHLGRTTMGIDVAAWWRPTAANYFGRVKKSAVLEAMTTIGGPELAGRYANAKKADIAEAAEKLCAGKTIVEAHVRVAATSWVPPIMTFGTIETDTSALDGDESPDADGDDDSEQSAGDTDELEEAA